MNRLSPSRSRRSLLHGQAVFQRPPWTDEERVAAACTSCGACIKACPEGILIPGPGRTPVVDFDINPCTFCGDCVAACEEPVFDLITEKPWSLAANINAACFLASGVECRSCTDVCDTSALRFRIAVGGGRIEVNPGDCSGCGACLPVCPTGAINLVETPTQEAMP